MSNNQYQAYVERAEATGSSRVKMTARLIFQYMLIVVLISLAFYDLTSAASKKFIKGFILGALLAKNNHYPVVVHEAHHKHKGF